MGQGTQQEASRADLPASQCDTEQFVHLQAPLAEGPVSSTCDVDLNFVFCAEFFKAH